MSAADALMPPLPKHTGERWHGMSQTPEKLYSASQVHVYAREYAASLAVPAVPVPQWLPIESAPKDGTPILIGDVAEDGCIYEVLSGHFEALPEDEDDGPWDIRGGEPWCSYIGRAAGLYFCNWVERKLETTWRVTETAFQYTHWMPAPAAPLAASPTPKEPT